MGEGRSKVTKVTGSARRLLGIVLGMGLFSVSAWGLPFDNPKQADRASVPLTAEVLYQQLGSVELDPSRVYEVRGTTFNRGPIQISLDDGKIAFTRNVAGRVTGAFFEGDGEVLLVPPDQAERSSMALFTGAAILEERFVSAYFRFNDDSFAQSQASLRPADDGPDFVAQWNPTARNLAAGDAFRLLLSFSEYLPTASAAQSIESTDAVANSDRMLHVRLQGRKLGTFDLYFDAAASEQIWAGQLKRVESGTYYNVWTSFSLREPGEHRTVNGITAEEGKSDTLEISGYKIRAEVTPPTTVNAEAALRVEVRHGGQRAALFELSRFLQIQTVEADGHPVEFVHNPALEGTQLARRGNDLVAVVFPEPLRTGQTVELRFVYRGDVLSEAGGGLLYVGARGTWYPNRGLAMADYDMEFRYPPGWTLLATGKRVEEAVSNPGSTASQVESGQVSHWISERPIPVAGFNLGKYSRAVAEAGAVKIETYAAAGMEKTFPKPHAEVTVPEIPSPGRRRQPPVIVTTPPPPVPSQNMQSLADEAARATEFFGQRFGPYPYSHLALTQMPGSLSQGWPGLIFLSSISFLTPQEEAELHMAEVDQAETEIIVPHETAHEWWGDLIVWSGYRDQWMFEGLANYSALMLVESQSPSKFRLLMDKYRDQLLQKNKDGMALLEGGPVTLGSRLSNSQFPEGYDAISYGRGTWLMHMLRCMLRDGERKPGAPDRIAATDSAEEPFLRTLRKVRERYQGKSITTRELINTFAEDLPPSVRYEGHKSLDWFYDGWVNGTALPRFELQGVRYLDRNNATIVTGTILQKSAPKDLVTPIPVYASLRGKLVFLGQVFADGPETPFKLTAPSAARRVVLDPGQTLLARLR
jgi:peptidase M1-like protein